MTNTKIVHCQNDPYDVYIGRPSIWGNPYKVSEGMTRKEAINAYRDWILYSPDAAEQRSQIHTLKGKTLGCWCKPKACHGDVLVEIINNGVLDLLS